MRTITFSLALCLILTAPVEAWMFQWTHPATGTVQLSGKPPAWYRGNEPGPRVFVFDNGELIDDTAVAVPEEERLALRARAFGAASPAELAPPPPDQGEELKAAMATAEQAGVDVDAVAAEYSAEQEAARAAAAEAAATEAANDRAATLKALVDEFDQRRVEQARALLELLPPEAPPAR
ncbi:MAG: hypothetical protein H6977_06550 [Gammaproteobacteria bacterium]|nr:hypothetical protein [Gammaproteobacteria bacterium]